MNHRKRGTMGGSRLALYIAPLLAGIMMLSGCARTATVIQIVGAQATLDITLKGTVDPGQNRYYIVFGTSSPRTPTPGDYFFAPGEPFDQNRFRTGDSLASYYSTYFSTWMDFIKLENGNFFTLTKGPFTKSASHESFSTRREFLSSRFVSNSSDAQKLHLNFFFSRLTAEPATLFFNVLAVDSQGILRDRFDFLDTNFQTASGTRLSGTDIESDADPALDIRSWSIEVQ